MTPWEKLLWLKERCVHVDVETNVHRVYYETVEQSLSQRDEGLFDPDESDVRAECIKRNEMSVVQAYPDTPISFYRVGHYDLGKAIEKVYEIILKERRPTSAKPGDP